jgi:hypothetical protein
MSGRVKSAASVALGGQFNGTGTTNAKQAMAMKTIVILTITMLLAQPGLLAQPAYFTRITDGPIATDVQRSWGCALVDYNNDGRVDVFVATVLGGHNSLYRNEGNFTFTPMLSEPVVNVYGDFSAGVFADYDNDGDLDLFTTGYDPYKSCFFRNDTGMGTATTFTHVSAGAWVNTAAASVAAAWGDYDLDGFVDLAVANGGASHQHEFLYWNDGAGGMEAVQAPPLTSSGGRSQASSWGDYDGDGDLDLFVVNSYDQACFLFRNDGGGTFFGIGGDTHLLFHNQRDGTFDRVYGSVVWTGLRLGGPRQRWVRTFSSPLDDDLPSGMRWSRSSSGTTPRRTATRTGGCCCG